MRPPRLTSQLRSAGCTDPSRALSLLEDPVLVGLAQSIRRAQEKNANESPQGHQGQPHQTSHEEAIHVLIKDLEWAPDPDSAILNLIRLAQTRDLTKFFIDELPHETEKNHQQDMLAHPRKKIWALLGHSRALSDYLITHPHILENVLDDSPLSHNEIRSTHNATRGVHNENTGLNNHDNEKDGIAHLRARYYEKIIRLAMADLTSVDSLEYFPTVSECISTYVGQALEEAYRLACAHIEDADKIHFTIIAMGKTGARELNYISDVDVMYITEPRTEEEIRHALEEKKKYSQCECEDATRNCTPVSDEEAVRIATHIATRIGKYVSSPGSEPALWVLDTGLRPEGKDGPLVRTLTSYRQYYERWAQGWEFQALLKARPIAGSAKLGEEFLKKIWPMVWNASSRENFVEDSRAMRARVESHISARDSERQLKLGKGGLRDVEFTVQLLQLVHGKSDTSLRVRPTLSALEALKEGGYVARKDAQNLDHHYRFLRVLEHRIQLQHMRRSHIVPSNMAELTRIARSMRIPGVRTGEEIDRLWQQVRTHVRSLHQEIYYRPLLPEAAKLSADDISLEYDAAIARLAGIGYRDPEAALGHIRALTQGISRTAAIQRQLLPVMIGWMTLGPDPDYGLLAFRILSDTMGRTSWYLRTLRDGGAACVRLCKILSTSRYCAEIIPTIPESVSWLVDTEYLTSPSYPQLKSELESMLVRRTDGEEIALAGRYLRKRELLRAAMGRILGLTTGEENRKAISLAADIALEAGLRAALISVYETIPTHVAYAVIAMGRLGGNELNYASDADVMMVYGACETHAENAEEIEKEEASHAREVAQNLATFLAKADRVTPLDVDYALRPEGKNGEVIKTVDAYRTYYERWALTWEKQALLRARFAAGDVLLGEKFIEMIHSVRYPLQGLSKEEERDIRLMKARVENERMPRGISASHHVKLGRGTLSDVEWTVQFLQLEYAGGLPCLHVTGTLEAIHASCEEGIISEEDALILTQAWEMASDIRDANVLATGKTRASKVDIFPHDLHEKAVVSAILGYGGEQSHECEEEFLRRGRRARVVVEKLLFGKE